MVEVLMTYGKESRVLWRPLHGTGAGVVALTSAQCQLLGTGDEPPCCSTAFDPIGHRMSRPINT
jgi:hypothetical protein